MISKELLSTVLGIPLKEIKKISFDNDKKSMVLITANIENHRWDNSSNFGISINIYELAYKVKEWALEQGYIIDSHLDYNFSDNIKGYWRLCYERNSKVVENMMFETCNTEPEAIFKAGQWILDQRNQDDN